MQISKSEYLMYLKFPALLWFKKNDKSKLPPIDANLQAIFDAGNLFEKYAEPLFENGVRVGFDSYNEYLSMPVRTEKELSNGAKVIFQGRFEAKNITCICDVIEVVGPKTFDLYEIKSGTSVKQENIYDLAFQTHVLQSAGYKVRKIFVITANSKYVRKGAINSRELCNITEVTEEVNEEIPTTVDLIDEIFDYLKTTKKPDLSPPDSPDIDVNAWLDLYLHINPSEKGSIFDLCWPKNRIAQLFAMGIEKLVDIPDDFPLSPKQKLQVSLSKSGESDLDQQSIKEFLSKFEYPLYFLDYETLSSVIPPFDGLSPYNQLPFQYSLHVQSEPGAQLEHFMYLHKENSDPTIPLSDSLMEHIGDHGTVLTWNEKFEKSCNDLMGRISKKHKKFYSDLNDRIMDLCVPFQKNWFVHKDFQGSYSIKKVLPVLVEDISYTELDINEGAGAQRLWMQSVLDGKLEKEKEKILSDLEKYCALDTLAMVRIYEELQKILDEGESSSESIIENSKKESVEKLSLF